MSSLEAKYGGGGHYKGEKWASDGEGLALDGWRGWGCVKRMESVGTGWNGWALDGKGMERVEEIVRLASVCVCVWGGGGGNTRLDLGVYSF